MRLSSSLPLPPPSFSLFYLHLPIRMIIYNGYLKLKCRIPISKLITSGGSFRSTDVQNFFGKGSVVLETENYVHWPPQWFWKRSCISSRLAKPLNSNVCAWHSIFSWEFKNSRSLKSKAVSMVWTVTDGQSLSFTEDRFGHLRRIFSTCWSATRVPSSDKISRKLRLERASKPRSPIWGEIKKFDYHEGKYSKGSAYLWIWKIQRFDKRTISRQLRDPFIRQSSTRL